MKWGRQITWGQHENSSKGDEAMQTKRVANATLKEERKTGWVGTFSWGQDDRACLGKPLSFRIIRGRRAGSSGHMIEASVGHPRFCDNTLV